MSELFDEVCVNLLMLLPLLLFFLSKGIVGVNITIAVHTSEDGPEYDQNRNLSATVKFFKWDNFTTKKDNLLVQ